MIHLREKVKLQKDFFFMPHQDEIKLFSFRQRKQTIFILFRQWNISPRHHSEISAHCTPKNCAKVGSSHCSKCPMSGEHFNQQDSKSFLSELHHFSMSSWTWPGHPPKWDWVTRVHLSNKRRIECDSIQSSLGHFPSLDSHHWFWLGTKNSSRYI